MLENVVERYLVSRVKNLGGWAVKFTSPSADSLPDRLIFMPGGRLYMIETKRPGKTASKKQKSRHREFRDLGFYVATLDTKEKIDEFLKSYILDEI